MCHCSVGGMEAQSLEARLSTYYYAGAPLFIAVTLKDRWGQVAILPAWEII